MNISYKNIILCTMCSFLFVGCAPKKNEEKQVEQKQMEEKKAPPAVHPAPQGSHKEGLTPEEKLKIEEDEVENPFPG